MLENGALARGLESLGIDAQLAVLGEAPEAAGGDIIAVNLSRGLLGPGGGQAIAPAVSELAFEGGRGGMAGALLRPSRSTSGAST